MDANRCRNALYNYYLRQKQYEKAETYLTYFSMQNPERKRKQAVLFEKSGEREKAYQTYEELLLSGAQNLFSILNSLFSMKLQEKEFEAASYYLEKERSLTQLFELGTYSAYAAELELAQAQQDSDRTIACVKELLHQFDTVYAFSTAPLGGLESGDPVRIRYNPRKPKKSYMPDNEGFLLT